MNEKLTERELSVVRLVAKGKTNQEIANELCISTSTVKAHLARIGLKLRAQNRAQIAYTVGRRRILTVSKDEMNNQQKPV